MKHQYRTDRLFTSFFQGILLILFSSLIFFPSLGIGRWEKIAQFPTTVNASFFLNEQIGFIGIDGVNGIKRTSDGGITWTDCIIPPGYSGFITDIYMRDSLHGWAGIENTNASHGLWRTLDGGISWSEDANYSGEVSSVYETPNGILVASRFSPNRLSFSTDGGITFSVAGLNKYTGINFVDDLHGIVSAFQTNSNIYAPVMRTSDGGRTLIASEGIMTEAWSVYAQKGTSNFYVVGEKSAIDPVLKEEVNASTDYGVTWQTISNLPGRTTGHVAGVGSIIYVQSETNFNQRGNDPSFLGLHRSTDGGVTWKNIGGPSNYRDTRFSVLGCQGSIVYAFDETGGVWKTTDGGDGLFQPNNFLSVDEITLNAPRCSVDSTTAFFSNISCNSIVIESIGFSDSSVNEVSRRVLTIEKSKPFPLSLASASSAVIELKWNPDMLGTQKPTSKIFIRIKGKVLSMNRIIDTLLSVNLLAKQPDYHPDSLVFSDVKLGSAACRTFVLRNSLPIGGASFNIESVILSNADTAYRIAPFISTTLSPQDSTLIRVCFNPLDTGIHLDSLLVKIDCFIMPIALRAQGVTGLIYADDLDFGSVNIGDTVCKNLMVKNVGKAPLNLLDPVALTDTVNFSIKETALPKVVMNGHDVQFQVCFHPQKERSYTANIEWNTDLIPDFKHSVKSSSILIGNGSLKSEVILDETHDSVLIRSNPVQDQLQIAIRSTSIHQTSIEIFDQMGKKVYSDKRYVGVGQNEIQVDINSLPVGIYYLRIDGRAQNFIKE